MLSQKWISDINTMPMFDISKIVIRCRDITKKMFVCVCVFSIFEFCIFVIVHVAEPNHGGRGERRGIQNIGGGGATFRWL